MRHAIHVIVVVLLFCSGFPALAQTNPATAAAPLSYDGEAAVVEQSETAIRYNTDGTGEKTVHVRVRLQNEAGARPFSVLSFPFASANESVQIQSVRVLHTDGTSTETPATDALEMPAPVTQQAPLYSDLKVQQIPVRGLRAGDILEYRVRIQRKNAESPSQFWDTFSFLKDTVVLAQSLTLDLPAEKYVRVWSPNHKPVVIESAGRRVYQWSNSQLKLTRSSQKKDEDPADPATDTKAEVAWTTFHNWEEVGSWYRALAAPRVVTNEALRAQAAEITRQATTPEEQVRALYSFVATRIRYVGIDFGVGRYQPHAATEVLANQYGDCKDKDTLLRALLLAKGFTAAPALIGAGIDMVPELPSPGLFNHVITFVSLPSGKLWMDTTTEVAPFQLLLAPLRDKQALVIPTSGAAALERTPAQTPFPFIDRFEATATLNADGVLTGHVEINSRSDNELALRTIARSLAPAQWDRGTQYYANLLGFSGKTSNSNFSRADETSAPMHVSYDYERKPFGDWERFRIVPLFPINFLPAPPEKQPSEEVDLGALRTEISTSRIRLPKDFGADLPDAIHVEMPFATFDKTYKLEAGELIAEKKLVVLQSKLPAASWQQYKKFVKDASLFDEAWVQLTSKSAIGSGPHPPRPSQNNPVAAELVSDANALERTGNWAAVLKKLDEAKKIEPEQPFLWSNYGYVAMRQNKPQEAKEHFRHELRLHPDETYVVQLYAGFLHQRREDEEARAVLAASFKSDPSQVRVALLLAMLQADSNLADAISTLRRAGDAAPHDRMIKAALGDYLIRNQQLGEAANLAKKQLEDAADDPSALNSAAYILAQAKTDLSFAEQSARKALELLGNETAISSVSEANAQSFRRTATLVATWDTLGFILLKENKLEEARNYLEAAWLNRADREVGNHYAQLQEALGDSKAALRIYELARSVRESFNVSAAPAEIDASIARLKKAGVVSTVNGNAIQILQDERTHKIKLKSALASYCSATFRLQLAAGSTEAVMRVNGDSSLETAIGAIKELRLPALVPSHSNARILRNAVLSCSPGQSACLFVLMPIGSIDAERIGD